MDEKQRIAFEAYDAAHKAGDKETAEKFYKEWVLGYPLSLSGKATDHIWCMEDVPGYVGVRMDSGDSGTVYLTHKQALDLAEQLKLFATP